jgi:hypothetical protein
MGARRTRDISAGLEVVRRRFEAWRRARRGRSRIPEPLWAAAVRVAGGCGIHRTAKALRVDYYSLKKRIEGMAAGIDSTAPTGTVGGRFLELPSPVWPGCGECTLEWEKAGGAKLRIHLKGFSASDLAALSRSFVQVES